MYFVSLVYTKGAKERYDDKTATAEHKCVYPT